MSKKEQNNIKSFRDLKVWQKSSDLAVLVYRVTEKFPEQERYGIVSQMRRAVISISSNIAEGFSRAHKKEKAQFYAIAHGSVSELESQLEISKKLGFLNSTDFEELSRASVEISKMISGLIKSTNTSTKKSTSSSLIVFLILLLAPCSLLLSPVAAYAAKVDITVPESTQPGERFVITLSLNTEGEQINAIEGEVNISEVLSLTGVRTGGSIISFWSEQPEAGDNTTSFSGVIPGGYSGSNGILFELELEATRVGTGTITVSDFSALLHDGLGTRSTSTDTHVSISVIDNAPPISQRFSRAEDIVPPEPFDIFVERSPDLFGGNYFAVFHAQDKGSGIAYYEVQESKSEEADRSFWERATSPYELSDQGLRSYIFVKAVDTAGNIRIVVHEPANDAQLLLYLIYGIMSMVVIYLLIYWYAARKNKKEVE